MKRVNIEKLFLVDIICHGVPSPKVYQAFRKFMTEKHKGKLEGVNFRNKNKFGWHSHTESLKINGNEYDSICFREMFYSHNILRPSCFQCPYKHTVHLTDITTGDCWGIENWAADFDDNKGISLTLVNTDKGQKLFSLAKKHLNYREARIQDCLQEPLKKPFEKPITREQFWYDFQRKPFNYILSHYTTDYGWKNKWKNKMRKDIKKTLKAVLPTKAIKVLKMLRG